MKALTVRQPHALAIVLGVKPFETRSWATPHRGPLAIHAAGRVDGPACDRLDEGWGGGWKALGLTGRQDLARQAIVGTVELVDCIPTNKVPADERVWGDFGPGRWAWVVKSPKVSTGKVRRVVGTLGLWEWSGK